MDNSYNFICFISTLKHLKGRENLVQSYGKYASFNVPVASSRCKFPFHRKMLD